MNATWRTPSLYVGLAVLTFVVLVQGTLLARIRFFGARPDLLLVVVVSWSLLHSVTDGLLWAFLGGLAVDIVAGAPIGASSLALMPVAFLGAIGQGRVFLNNTLLPLMLVVVATALHGLITLLISQIRGIPGDWSATAVQVVLPAMALNVLLAIVMVPVMRWLAGRLEPARAG